MKKIKSPCLLKCKYDKTTHICVACYRSKDEIINWIDYNSKKRLEVLEKIKQRKKKK